jgi:hypothetical protein
VRRWKLKLTDFFTPEEFFEFMRRPVTTTPQEVYDSVDKYVEILVKDGRLTDLEIALITSTLGLVDKAIREKTLESNSVN